MSTQTLDSNQKIRIPDNPPKSNESNVQGAYVDYIANLINSDAVFSPGGRNPGVAGQYAGNPVFAPSEIPTGCTYSNTMFTLLAHHMLNGNNLPPGETPEKVINDAVARAKIMNIINESSPDNSDYSDIISGGLALQDSLNNYQYDPSKIGEGYSYYLDSGRNYLFDKLWEYVTTGGSLLLSPFTPPIPETKILPLYPPGYNSTEFDSLYGDNKSISESSNSPGWFDGIIDSIKSFLGQAEKDASPLILDLDGDGIETASISDKIYFDHDNNGFAEQTGWASPDDAFFVRDRDGNGKIDSGNELFGNNTDVINGKAANGFVALATMDSNGDAIVDANDEGWDELRLWRDLNGNGAVDEGELLTLDEAGVAGLYTDYQNSTFVDNYGNQHRQSGSYLKTDGTIADMTDVWFIADPVRHQEVEPIEVPQNIADLPDFKGYGLLSSFHQTMARDSDGKLQTLVEEFISETDVVTRHSLSELIIYAWADIENYSDMRGSYISEGKIATLEKLLARTYNQSGWGNKPGPNATIQLEKAFNALVGSVYAALSFQAHYSELYQLSVLAVVTSNMLGMPLDVSSVIANLEELYERNEKIGGQVVQDFIKLLGGAGDFGQKILTALETDFGIEKVFLFPEDSFMKILSHCIYPFIAGTSGDDVLRATDNIDSYLSGEDGNDTLTGGKGNDGLLGGAGNDTLKGNAGNDILVGGAGNDSLEGGTGDDVYLFGIGDGHDTISETESDRTDRRNVIRLGEGIGVDDVELLATNYNTVYGYMDLVIRIKSTGETLTVFRGLSINKTSLSNPYSIQAIEFADGTVWEYADIMKQQIHGADTDTAIYAEIGGSILVGNELANTMNGSSRADTLYGGAGNDTLKGNAGNDILVGGVGNDRLEGGTGDDVYQFSQGDGVDTLSDSSGNDKLFFGKDINFDDVWFTRTGNDLVIDILGTTDRVNIKSWFSNASYQVETITVGDMEIVNTQMNQILQAMAGFGVPGGVDGRLTEEQKDAMAPILSTYWKPTGS
jgi:hypothetical protein